VTSRYGLLGFVSAVLVIVSGCTASVGTESGAARSVDTADKAALTDLVLVQQGSMPIILTAPHGGRAAIPAVEPRRAQDNTPGPWGGVHTGADSSTDLLASGIAAELGRLTGRDPYLVVARFARKYIDANRPPELGLEDPRARPYYDYYQHSIRRFVDEIRANYPAGLLIDVHGQAKDPDVIMRGTLNGRAVQRLMQRGGVEAVTGPRGVFGQLEVNGFKVFPRNDVPPRGTSEDGGFNGGYTVFTYGSHNRDGIDAVQMEFGTRYRQKTSVARSARDAARAIATFYESYLRRRADTLLKTGGLVAVR
jgi:N-formylglutamate amidohydrolase